LLKKFKNESNLDVFREKGELVEVSSGRRTEMKEVDLSVDSFSTTVHIKYYLNK